MTDQRVFARYTIETPLTLEAAAAAMAGEQSSGTFMKIPGETPEIVERHGARVENVRDLGSADRPSLPGSLVSSAQSGGYRRGDVLLSWPLHNIGASIPNLMATVCGNLTELRELSGIRLTDIDVPEPFLDAYPGPRHGVAGTRSATGVQDRPLIGTIIKPSVGLSPEQTAGMVDRLIEGGIDFIKDDELIASPPYSTIEARVRAVMPVIERHADRTGRKVMYAFNITGELDEMRRHHDLVLDAGGTCVMLSLNWCGPPAVGAMRRHSPLVLHGHRNGWGMLSRDPVLGMDFRAYQKIWRLLGIDHIHVNGIRNKFSESDDSVIRSALACREPLLPGVGREYRIMPVFSSAQSADQAAETYRAVGTTDLIYACGGGIMGHPDGISGGVASIRQAWEAATAGITVDEYARDHPELQAALRQFRAGK